MPFHPQVDQELIIDGASYHLAPHPGAPGMPYGQEGRQATVYQLLARNEMRALKVFKARYQLPALVGLARRLEPWAALQGLAVCKRTMLTPQRHGELLRQHPDLTYAVLMPWIAGPTWFEVILEKRALSPEESLRLARSFASTLSTMEQEGLAHCDVSGPNVLLPALAASAISDVASAVELVDVEQMYGPGLDRPAAIPSGSPGYAHHIASSGLWSHEADRFAGAMIIAEMLAWSDQDVRGAAWGESYFEPAELQRDCDRYDLLISALQAGWGGGISQLFERVWRSATLDDCPTFGQWLVTLPTSVSTSYAAQTRGTKAVSTPAQPLGQEAIFSALVELARRLEDQGNPAGALEAYKQAQSLGTADPNLLPRIELKVRDLGGQDQRAVAETSLPAAPASAPPQKQPEKVVASAPPVRVAPLPPVQWQDELQTVSPAESAQGDHIAYVWQPLPEIPAAQAVIEKKRARRIARFVFLMALNLGIIGSVVGLIWYGLQPCNWLDSAFKVSGCTASIQDSAYATYAVAYNASGQLTTVNSDGYVHEWDVSRSKTLSSAYLAGDWRPEANVQFSSDGKFIAGSSNGSESQGGRADEVGVWAAGGNLLWMLQEASYGMAALAFSPDDKYLAVATYRCNPDGTNCGAGGWLRLYQASDGKQASELEANSAAEFKDLAFSPDGTLLAVVTSGEAGGDRVTVHNLATGETKQRDEYGIEGVAFSPDKKLMAAAYHYDTLALWGALDVSDQRVISTSQDNSRLRFSPDGRLVAGGSVGGREAGVWRVSDGSLVRKIDLPGGSIQDITFSRDGWTLAIAGQEYPNSRIWLYDLTR